MENSQVLDGFSGDNFEMEMLELYEIRKEVKRIDEVYMLDRLSAILRDVQAIHLSLLEIKVIVLTISMEA